MSLCFGKKGFYGDFFLASQLMLLQSRSLTRSHAPSSLVQTFKHGLKKFPKILFFIYLSFLRGSDNLYGDFYLFSNPKINTVENFG